MPAWRTLHHTESLKGVPAEADNSQQHTARSNSRMTTSRSNKHTARSSAPSTVRSKQQTASEMHKMQQALAKRLEELNVDDTEEDTEENIIMTGRTGGVSARATPLRTQ